jgi:hypothetical protein
MGTEASARRISVGPWSISSSLEQVSLKGRGLNPFPVLPPAEVYSLRHDSVCMKMGHTGILKPRVFALEYIP